MLEELQDPDFYGTRDLHTFTTTYRALLRETLTQTLSQAGFAEVRWLMPDESGFYQPIVLALT